MPGNIFRYYRERDVRWIEEGLGYMYSAPKIEEPQEEAKFDKLCERLFAEEANKTPSEVEEAAGVDEKERWHF